jgi:hypothetical protein
VCVLGAADYWTNRGEIEPIVMFRQIEFYCSSSEWTLKKRRMQSGSQKQLIQEAENSQEQIRALLLAKEVPEAKVRAFENQESLALRRSMGTAIKFAFNCAVLTGAFILVTMRPTVAAWEALAFVGILAVFFLFLEGNLAESLCEVAGRFGSSKGQVTRGLEPTRFRDGLRNPQYEPPRMRFKRLWRPGPNGVHPPTGKEKLAFSPSCMVISIGK